MRAMGFNFTKISIENIKDITKDLKINTEIDIQGIEPTKPKNTPLKTKEDLLVVKFVYNINYDPDFVKINLEGRILFTLEPKIAKEVVKQWKDKKMPDDFRLFLFNVILKKSTLKALQLEDELNIPLHIPLPALKKPKDEG